MKSSKLLIIIDYDPVPVAANVKNTWKVRKLLHITFYAIQMKYLLRIHIRCMVLVTPPTRLILVYIRIAFLFDVSFTGWEVGY